MPVVAQPQSSVQARQLTTVESIEKLGNERAGSSLYVHLKAQVTYVDATWGILFVKDATGSIFVNIDKSSFDLKGGEIIDLYGTTAKGAIGPIIAESRHKIVGHADLTPTGKVDITFLQAGGADSRLVLAEGVLRLGTPQWNHGSFILVSGSSRLPIIVANEAPELKHLVGAKVLVTGISAVQLDSAGRRLGSQLFVQSANDVRVQEAGWKDVLDSQLTSVSQVRNADVTARFEPPVHVRGTVAWRGKGCLFLTDRTGGVYIETPGEITPETGATVDVIGFPTLHDHVVVLSDAHLTAQQSAPAASKRIPDSRRAEDILKSRYDGDLVRLSGRVISQSTLGKDYSFVLEDHGTRYQVVVAASGGVNGFVTVSPGSVLEATGVVRILQQQGTPNRALQVLVASPTDLVVRDSGPLNWRIVYGSLAMLAAAGGLLWVFQTRRALRRQAVVIREQLEHEAQLEGRYRRLFERNLAAVFTWLPSGEVVDCNEAFARVLGFNTPAKLIGKSYWSFLTKEGAETLRAALASGNVNGLELCLHCLDGSNVYLLQNITLLHKESSVWYETTALDVTQSRQDKIELQRARDRAQREADNDALTGLPNRRLFSQLVSQHLESAAANGNRVALLYVDLDGFKSVNDTLGHTVGDMLLKQVTRRLEMCMLPGNTLCRIGGDEFAVLITRTEGISDPMSTAGFILDALRNPFIVDGQELTVGASIGVSIFPDPASDCTSLLRQADSAMYVAKRSGRNRVVRYTREIGSAVHERNQILTALKRAIARREISVQYQPEFNSTTNELVRFEALGRWESPTLGSVSPSKFIPVAEESGLISELGALILETACRDAVEWEKKTGHRVPVAVNVSTVQFRSESFVEDVLKTVARTGFSPECLILEMTESIMLHDSKRCREMLQELRSHGIGLALDDFGTGYSCLSYLRQLPFDHLKVDRSFLTQADLGRGGEAMISAVVSLAHTLDMSVVVEGIETRDELEFVRNLGADEVQGYLLGIPTSDPVAVIRTTSGTSHLPVNVGGVELLYQQDIPHGLEAQ